MYTRRFALAIAMSFGILTTACSDDDSATAMGPEPSLDIVATAAANPSFTTLVTALEAADLVGTLRGEGPFTVFAPTDEAFAALPAGTVESLLLPENRDQLIAILTYHVVPGEVGAAEVVTLSSATTVQGTDIDISVEDGLVKVDGATVVQTDIETSNGIIHVIDSVILP